MRQQGIGNGSSSARIPAPFAAAVRALQLQSADTSMLRSLRDAEWRELLPMMDRARLTLPLAQKAHLGLPCWVKERLEKNLADTAQHWKRVQAAYREAASTLDAGGVEFLVLKGFTQAPDFVPRPELRRQGDIDFYVPREHIPEAVRRLQDIGYASCYAEGDYRYADHVPTLVRFGAWKWSGDIYDPEVPPAVEIHFCFWNDSVSSIEVPEVELFWTRRGLRTCEELLYPGLHPVDHLGYFAMHILRNIFSSEAPVHHVRELAVFLDRRASDDAFWREWTVMHSQRLRRMQTVACSLAAAWFSCSVPDAVKAEIDSLSPQVEAWIDTCGSAPLENLFRRTRDGRLLQFLLAETPEARKTILWKALTPGRVAGPAKVASFETHPSMLARRNLVSGYLTYPAYILSRVWMHGRAILRFLVHAFLVLVPRVGQQRTWFKDFGDAPTE